MKAVKYLIAAIVIFLSSSSYAQYTGTSINNLNTSTPTENGSFMYEYNDAIREIKTVLKNQYAIGSKTANYTTTASDSIIHIRSGTWTISLGTPTAYSSVGHTKSFIIKNTGTQTASVSPGSKKIEGTTTAYSLAGSASVYLWTDGNDWYELVPQNSASSDNSNLLDSQDSTYYTNASNLVTGTVSLDRIPSTLTGKDADTLDGQEGSYYRNASNLNAGTIPLAQIPDTLTGKDADTLDGQHGSYYRDAANLNAGTIPLAQIPSTLTGKDADTLDTIDSTGFVQVNTTYIKQWTVGSTTGTGTLNLAAGIGISLVPTYSDGNGTITVNSVGTASAGGWVDTGTQTISIAGYPIICQGTLTVSSVDGILGLLDRDIPNTITLDNITQIGTRLLSDMQGGVSLATQTSSLLSLGTQTNGVINLATQTSGNYIKDWTVGAVLGTGSVNIVTSNYATSSATYSGGSGTITIKTLTRNQVFISSGSFSVPSDTTKVLVTCLGGGAGGSNGGVGGGAGGLVFQYPMSVTPSGTVTVSIGSGGGTAVGGGNTSFGTLTAYGGTSGGAGGYSSVNSAITTDAGDPGVGNSGGAGGHSNWGQGGNGGSNAQVGFTGSGYGSGGGGGGFSGSWYAGGTGTAGLCIVNF